MLKQTHTDRGKWMQPGIPHRGWTNIDIEDLGENTRLCMMCESVHIRYAHRMEHPKYEEILLVGSICAQNMAEDYVAIQREQEFKNLQKRKLNWKKKKWTPEPIGLGGFRLNADGTNIWIRPNRDATKWTIYVRRWPIQRTETYQENISTMEKAKLLSFDAMLWAKENIKYSKRPKI